MGAWAIAGKGPDAAVGLMKRRPVGPPSAATRGGTVRIEGDEVPALQIPYSRRKQWHALIGSLGFVATGVGFVFVGVVWLGVACTATFGLFILLGLFHLVRTPVE